jgi:SAM-dependent methyltransferase
VEEFLRPWDGARLLDAGCGTGLLLDDLPSGIEYVGFDANEKYIEEARRRYGGRATFHCASVGAEANVVGDGAFDFFVAKSFLHHLDDASAHHLLTAARRALRPGGIFFSSDAVRHEGQSFIARMLAALDRGRNVRRPEEYRSLINTHFPVVETWLVTDLLPVPYSHFIIRAGNGLDSGAARRDSKAAAAERHGDTTRDEADLE